MPAHHREEFDRGHLKGDRDVLIGVDEDHVVLRIDGLQEGAAVVFGDLYRVRQVKVPPGQLGDLSVDLHALDRAGGKIIQTLPGIGARPVAEHEHARLLLGADHGRGERVVVIHARETAVLHHHRLHAEEHVGRKHDAALVLLDLQVVVDRFALVAQVLFPESEGIPAPEDRAEHVERQGDHGGAQALLRAEEENERDHKQDPGKEEEGDGGADRRDRDEGGQEGAEDAADRVAGAETAHRAAAFVQAFGRRLHQRRRDRAEQEQRKDEQQHAGNEGRDRKKVRADREDQQCGHAQDHISPQHGDGRDPDRRDQDAAVERRGIGIFVRRAPAVEIAQRHRDHDRADNDRPHDLRGTEIRREQAARAELDRHDGHAGEKLGDIQKQLAFQNRVFFHRPHSRERV